MKYLDLTICLFLLFHHSIAQNGTMSAESLELSEKIQLGSGFLNQDIFEINTKPGLNPFRVRTNGTTRLRIFENGGMTLLGNWSNPQPGELRINGYTGIRVNDPLSPLHVSGGGRFSDEINNGEIILSPNTGGLIFGPSISMDNLNGNRTLLVGAGTAFVDFGILQLSNSDGQVTAQITGEDITGSHEAGILELKSGGTTKIRLDANYNNSGIARTTTDELEIRGGSDLSEYFDLDEKGVKPGMLVSIDPTYEGRLRLSTKSYDRQVAGVVSGANDIHTGILMGQEGTIADGSYPVALAGRVYLLANSEGGSISPGDLLTTSSTPGYAMKAKSLRKAQGAIVGKSMTTLNEDSELVLVLVNLQ
ncbi:MAG: hypothetical protein HKN87_10305 [Saprospiraceae bacterium]|nr:hypothetical protein [Saprospiraceae bacterium]